MFRMFVNSSCQCGRCGTCISRQLPKATLGGRRRTWRAKRGWGVVLFSGEGDTGVSKLLVAEAGRKFDK